MSNEPKAGWLKSETECPHCGAPSVLRYHRFDSELSPTMETGYRYFCTTCGLRAEVDALVEPISIRRQRAATNRSSEP